MATYAELSKLAKAGGAIEEEDGEECKGLSTHGTAVDCLCRFVL